MYKTVRELCDPVLPKNKLYDELCVILRNQLSARTAVFKERKELRQKQGEKINQLFVRVKSKARNFNFAQQLDMQVKDKFVTGLFLGRKLDKICEEDHNKLLQALVVVA